MKERPGRSVASGGAAALLVALPTVAGGVQIAGANPPSPTVRQAPTGTDQAATPDPLQEDIRFRSLMGLATDREHVMAAREAVDVSESVVPFALFPEEEAQVRRQLELQSALADLEPSIAGVAGDGYAGVSVDQTAGGRITIKVKGLTPDLEERLRSVAPAGAEVDVVDVPRSQAEIVALSDRLTRVKEELEKQHGIDLLMWGYDFETNTLGVQATADERVPRLLAEVLDSDAITVSYAEGAGPRALAAGLGMRKAGGNADICTSNVLVRQNGGPIRLLTAGHCENPSGSGSLTGQSWKVNGTVYGAAVKNGYSNGSSSDIALIQRSGSYNNCIKKDNGTCPPVTGTSNSPHGAVMMSQGLTTGLRSGTVGASGNVTFDDNNGVIMKNQAKVTNETCPGDSGAPIYEYFSQYDTARIAGVLHGGPQGQGAPPGCGPTVYTPWRELSALGIYPE